jgi:hypothetical protein
LFWRAVKGPGAEGGIVVIFLIVLYVLCRVEAPVNEERDAGGRWR